MSVWLIDVDKYFNLNGGDKAAECDEFPKVIQALK